MTSTAFGFNLAGAAEFWRVAQHLHTIYAELDRTFELGTGPCAELEHKAEPTTSETLERVCQWFERIDAQVQVWQLRQLLQSTNLQTDENLRYLIVRHLEKKQKTESDKEKIDFLLVQYLAHCAPHGITEQHITLEGVARVLEPAVGQKPAIFPEWAGRLDEKLQKMNACESLEELQDSGALTEAREMKAAAGDHYFQPALLVAFTRFNFLARRAFFRAMHVDLHAIRDAVNELERRGIMVLDCREAGLSEQESLEHVRHLIHQWKTPFRAPYSGGSSFQQLIVLRQALQRALENPGAAGTAAAHSHAQNVNLPKPPASSQAASMPQMPAEPPAPLAQPAAQEEDEEHDYLQRCVADITEQLAAVPPKHTLGVSTISLAGCKLMIATWEADAFRAGVDPSPPLRALQRAVAARTILHVCMERQKKHEETNLELALDIARRQVEEMKGQVEQAKEASNIDAAVNLAATAKRLATLMVEGEKLRA